MGMTLLWGALAGGAIAWVWGAISWMALPWHHATFLPFTDEPGIERAILAASPVSGVYGMPAPPRHAAGTDAAARAAADRQAQARMIKGPIVTAVVQRDGFGSVPMAMIRAFIIYALVGAGLTWLLLQAPELSYWRRVTFVAGVTATGGLLCRLPDWNWHGYSTSFTIVHLADHIVAGFLMGLALARLA